MFRLIYLLLAFVAQTVGADTIVKLPMQELPVGTILIYGTPSNKIESRRVTVNTGERLEIAVSRNSPQLLLKHTLVLDANGLTKKLVYPSGREMLFEPHNCYRVVGICSFEVTDAAKQTVKRVHRSRLTEGVMEIEITDHLGAVLETQKIEFDENGMALMFQRQRKGQPLRTMRLLRAIRPDGSDYMKR